MFAAKQKLTDFMKKLFLFVAVAAMAFSCSSDDDNGGGSGADSISFKVDGVQKNLTSVVVNEDEDEEGDVFLTVTGTIGNSTENVFTFNCYQGDVGSDMAFNFGGVIDGDTHFAFGMNNVIQTNTNSKLKGSFSGTMMDGEGNSVEITDGTFDVSY